MEIRIILLWLGSLWVAMSSVNCVYMVGDREVTYFWQAKNWFTAYEMCRAQGKHLLTIHSDEENIQIMRIAADYCSDAADEFRKQCRGKGFWLAATDLGQYRKFVWMDSGSQVETTWWAPGQPDNFFLVVMSAAWRSATSGNIPGGTTWVVSRSAHTSARISHRLEAIPNNEGIKQRYIQTIQQYLNGLGTTWLPNH